MLPIAPAIAFFRSPVGRWVGIALLAALVLGGVYLSGFRTGRTAGRVDGAKETLESLRSEMETERGKMAERVRLADAEKSRLDLQVSAQNEIISRQQALIGSLDRRLAELDARRRSEGEAIARMSDPEVLLDLARRLAIRDPKDATLTLYPAEIRKANVVAAEHGTLAERVGLLEQKIEAQRGEIGAIGEKARLADERTAVAERKFAAAMDYIERADQRFADAYNIVQKIHPRPLWQRILTFGLLKNKKIQELKPIAPPERPTEIQKAR